MIRILGIEENVNSLNDIKKFVKRSKISLFNIPHENKFLIDKKELKFFKSKNVKKQLNEISLIKNQFDLCVVSSWRAARLAYLSGIDYVINFVGNDIRIPPFEKNSRPIYFNESVNNLNWIQRLFYKKIFQNASECVSASDETFSYLFKFRKDGIRIDRTVVDTNIFNLDVKPKTVEKQKFTFFCPQRIGLEKGTSILWDALRLCKSDFDVIQCEWYDETSKEAFEESQKMVENIPKQVKLIPKIPREDMPKYYAAYDGILGEMQLGLINNIEREASFFKKPVICYYNSNLKYLIDQKRITAPFLPNSNNPDEIASVIDKVVNSVKFREELAEKEFDFISEYGNPEKAAAEWDTVFYKAVNKKRKKTSKLQIFCRNLLYTISHKSNNSTKDVILP